MIKKKIVLADGAPFGLELMKIYLRESSLTVFTATDSASLLLLAQRHRPQLIVVDHALPGIGGLACCRELKKSQGAPVILLAATTQPELLAAGREAGADAVLTKPLDRKVFLETGRTLLNAIDRREPRIPCRATVAYRTAENTGYGTIEDVSAHGMFIGTPRAPEVGSRLTLKFLLPWHQAHLIATAARVTWVNDGRQRRKSTLFQGFGVEFVDLSPEDGEHLQDFIAYSNLRQDLPEEW